MRHSAECRVTDRLTVPAGRYSLTPLFMTRKPDSKDAILDAAEAVVTQAGAAHLTLDAVAARAKVSKGGLLYHFPSKEALVQSMIKRVLERVDHDQAKFHGELAPSPGADLQAHVLAGFQDHPDRKRVSAALLAAGANDPRLLDPVRIWQKKQFHELARSKGNTARAAVVMLAMDGLWLNDLLQTSPLGAEDRRQVEKELLELARSAA